MSGQVIGWLVFTIIWLAGFSVLAWRLFKRAPR